MDSVAGSSPNTTPVLDITAAKSYAAEVQYHGSSAVADTLTSMAEREQEVVRIIERLADLAVGPDGLPDFTARANFLAGAASVWAILTRTEHGQAMDTLFGFDVPEPQPGASQD